MTWTSNWPIGTVSVKSNGITGRTNTTYIEEKMGNEIVGTNTVTTRDHFWNVDADLDGHHRFVKSPQFTVGGVAADPEVGTSMDGVLYLKETNTDKDVQGFYRNITNVYQYIPSFRSGTHIVTSSYTDLLTVPVNSYGEIFMWVVGNGSKTFQSGFFHSNSAFLVCEAWATPMSVEGTSTLQVNVKFANGNDISGLKIRVKTESATPNLTWQYRITYRTT